MLKKVVILGANGQTSQLLVNKILETEQDFQLFLYLRYKERLVNLEKYSNVQLIEGDLNDPEGLSNAVSNADVVLLAVNDSKKKTPFTHNTIEAIKKVTPKLERLIVFNVLGIYDEVPGKFGRWNKEMLGSKGLTYSRKAASIVEESGLPYTIIRLPWLNNRPSSDYTITCRTEKYIGTSISRYTLSEFVLELIKNESYLQKENVGVTNNETKEMTTPLY